MQLLTLENEQLVLNDVTIDEKKFNTFFEQILYKYGDVRKLEIKRKKLKTNRELYMYCNHYEDDLEIVGMWEDTTMVHKGRKRISRKETLKKYVYRFTAIDYPEILYDIGICLKNKTIDFGIFDKYLKANTNINYNDLDFYISKYYKSYDKEAVKRLKDSLKTNDLRIKYINETIVRRMMEASVLKDLYELLDIVPIDKAIIIEDESQLEKYRLISGLYQAVTTNDFTFNNGKITNPNVVVKTPDMIDLAKRNSEFISTIKGYSCHSARQLKDAK